MNKIPNLGKAHNEVISVMIQPRSYWGTKRKKCQISYSVLHSPVGKFWVASVRDGICFVGCGNNKELILKDLQRRFPFAEFHKDNLPSHQQLLKFFNKDWKKIEPIHLCVKATPFQEQVWRTLLEIPVGKVCSYVEVANKIGRPKSARAVGRVVGQNPIAYLIPCHRVICANGNIGNFYWGVDEKLKFLRYESCSGEKKSGFSNWEPTLF